MLGNSIIGKYYSNICTMCKQKHTPKKFIDIVNIEFICKYVVVGQDNYNVNPLLIVKAFCSLLDRL